MIAISTSWIPQFTHRSPAFGIFKWLSPAVLAMNNWPDLADYNALALNRSVRNSQELAIRFVAQAKQQDAFESCYEPRIFLTGEVQTRCDNWHDFFNVLIWCTFPEIKARLNHFQYHELKKRAGRSSQRSALENFLTLFDENGVVIVSSDSSLLNLVQEMQWQEFFWHKREAITKRLACYVVGHSLHEKLLNPYIGVVGHSLLLKVNEEFFDSTWETQIAQIQAQCLALDLDTLTPHHLFPAPILGFPNWSEYSMDASFYENERYFRKNKSRREAPFSRNGGSDSCSFI